MHFVWQVIFAAVAGWLAGKLVKGESFGFIGNLVIGIVGSVLGGALFSRFGVSAGGGWLGSLVVATVGAVLLLFLVRLIKRI